MPVPLALTVDVDGRLLPLLYASHRHGANQHKVPRLAVGHLGGGLEPVLAGGERQGTVGELQLELCRWEDAINGAAGVHRLAGLQVDVRLQPEILREFCHQRKTPRDEPVATAWRSKRR